jgi:hypothetical protein
MINLVLDVLLLDSLKVPFNVLGRLAGHVQQISLKKLLE